MKVVSLDIGGTNTRAALIDEKHEILKTNILPTVRGDVGAFLDNVKKCVIGLGDISDVAAFGGGVPGRVRKDGFVYALPNVGVAEIPLADYLREAFGKPAYIANDAEIAALAESNLGEYKDAKSLYFATISTGFGGALTIGGKLKETSYEVGHSVFSFKGRYIEFEHYTSGGGILNLARENGLVASSTKEFFDLVRSGDPIAKQSLDEWLGLVSSFFNMVQRDYSPEVFALTGGVMRSSDCFLEDLRKLCPDSDLRLCSFKEEAGLQGGAVLAYQALGALEQINL